jgi:hypothetical protein
MPESTSSLSRAGCTKLENKNEMRRRRRQRRQKVLKLWRRLKSGRRKLNNFGEKFILTAAEQRSKATRQMDRRAGDVRPEMQGD